MIIEYFDNNESQTPQNTPSAKKATEFSLKNIDFSKYLESRDDYSSANNKMSHHTRHELTFCSNTLIGNGKFEVGCTTDDNKQKVIF